MDEMKLADRMVRFEESATLALNAKAKAMIKDGKTVYNLTVGELPCNTPKYIVEAVAEKLYENKYTPGAGLPELREMVAAETNAFYNLDWINPANVVVTASVKPGLFTALLVLVNPDDEVLLPKPYWFSYKYEVAAAGGTPIDVDLDKDFDLDIEKIEQAITPKTKAIILSSPSNPTSSVYSEAALRQLVTLLNSKGIYAIVDDIYAKLVFEDNFKNLPTYGFENMVILGGFSKSQALTGWRIGYLIANKTIARAAATLQGHIIGNAPLPSQHAAIAALKNGDQPVMLKELKQNRDFLVDKLASADNIRLKKPAGAFYGFLDIRKITNNSQDWCDQLLEKAGVAVIPGEAFFTPGFVRLNFAADQKILGPALDLIIEFSKKGSDYA